MLPLIILHGAWHQPAHFDDLARRLRRKGADVTVPDIGNRPIVETTALVQDLVDLAAEPPVVLAHSYGGFTAGGLRGLSQLIFLAALVFEPGETLPRGRRRARRLVAASVNIS